jgi:ketosteroid isomerase-like protein
MNSRATARSHAEANAENGPAASDENANIVRRGYHAFNTADIKLLTELFDEHCSWHTPGRTSIAGVRKGRDAVFAHFGRYGGETAGSFKAELQYVLADRDGRVVAVHRNTGLRNGKSLDVVCCIVFEITNGRVVSGKEHFFDLYAWDAFWS